MPIHVFLYAHACTCAHARNHTHNISKRNMKWNRSLCSSLCLLNTTDSALGNKHVCLTDKGLNTTNTCPSFKELTSAKMKEVCVGGRTCTRVHMWHKRTHMYAAHRSTLGQPWILFPGNCLSTLLFHWVWNSQVWPRVAGQPWGSTCLYHPPHPPSQLSHSTFLLNTRDEIQIQAFYWLNYPSTSWNTFLKNNFKYKDKYQGDVVCRNTVDEAGQSCTHCARWKGT